MKASNHVFSAPLQQLVNEHESLRAEMNTFYEMTEEIECESGPIVVQLFAELYNLVSDFSINLMAHSTREEEGLFPVMNRRLGKNDTTIEEMEEEHGKAEQHLEDFLTEAAQAGSNLDEEYAQFITVYAVQVYATLTQHFAKEEKVLFPLAEKILSKDEMEELDRLHQVG